MTQKVLVVDDDPAISEMLTLVLSTEGFASVVVNDGGQAVEVFQRENPDLVLLDLGHQDVHQRQGGHARQDRQAQARAGEGRQAADEGPVAHGQAVDDGGENR